MAPSRTKKRNEQVGLAFVFFFFLLLFLYLRMVMQHADEIRMRHDAQRRRNADDADEAAERRDEQRRSVVEMELEGDVVEANWDLLKRKSNPGVTLELKDSSLATAVTTAPSIEPAAPTAALGATHAPVKATSSPAVRNKEEEEQLNKLHIYVRPLNASEHSFLNQLTPIAPLSGNKLTALYADVVANTADHFFQTNEHIFSHVPSFKDLLQRWQTLNIEMRSGKRRKRFVVVHPVGQLCNRLMAITSAALFAMLTKRGLVVDDGGFYAQSQDLFEQPGFEWVSYDAPLSGSTDNHFITNPESGIWEHTEKLLCGDWRAEYHYDNVDISINQYLVPYLAQNPFVRKDLQQLLRGNDVFYPLSHFLFRPIKKILDLRDAFVRDHFHGRFVVGLQVRSGGDFTDNFMKQRDWLLYRDCAEATVPKERRSSVLFFLATDTEQGRAAGIPLLSTSRLNISHDVVVSTPAFLLSNHPEGVQMALLDLLLLSAADDRVHTAWSSYGYFAAGYSGVDANMVVDSVPVEKIVAHEGEEQRFMGIPHKSDKRRQCVRLPTHQPCFHKFESWGASRASCFSKRMFEEEMMNGRYC